MQRPSIERLPGELAAGALAVARTLGAAGWRAWLVGGAVRDLALGLVPKDVDLASAATPAQLEGLFPSTHEVGKAFGTVVVRAGALDVQVTTFRSESGYDDARRPTHVRFSTSLEEDAARRDFTCNALYLDPLTDELCDPTGGLADLALGRLRCVGDARERFAEDGLRLLRLARFAAQYALEPDAATLAGARAALDALRGVSPERVLAELTRLSQGPRAARAVRLLFELGALERLPGLRELAPPLASRVVALERLAEPGPGPVRFFATLLRPAGAAEEPASERALLGLRPARELQGGVARTWRLAEELALCLGALAEAAPSRWIRLVRSAEFEDALALHEAWHPEGDPRACRELRARAARLSAAERWPAPLVTSAELARAGIPRGPRWAELLRAAEDRQLDGTLRTLEEARAWLVQEAALGRREELP